MMRLPFRGRFRLVDVVQWFLVFLAGFLTRNLIDLAQMVPLPEQCPPALIQTEQDDLLPRDVHIQLRESYSPKTTHEVIRFDYFNASSIMNNFDYDPRTGLLGHQKTDIKDILHQALNLHNTGKNAKWKMNKLVNGYRRMDPLRGEEYLLDLVLELDEGELVKQELVRVELVKPYGPAQLIGEHLPESNRVIHIIVPVRSDNMKLETFLHRFEDLCSESSDDIYLLLVIFINKAPGQQWLVSSIKEITGSISRKHHNAHISVVQTRKKFSRAMGIDLGVKQLPQNALMFFCDVEIIISVDFLHRCKQNTEMNKRVFYPMVFAQYDPQIIQQYSSIDQDMSVINKHTGYWVNDGFEMTCLYAADFRSVGGFDLQATNSGGEDVDLYKKHVQSSLKILRAADPGLIRVYQTKTCDPDLTPDQLKLCTDSRAEARGSRQQLAKALLDHTE